MKQETKNATPSLSIPVKEGQDELKIYSFTDEDINLITFAVRRLSETTGFMTIKDDADNLLEYIERLKKENH